MPTTLLAKIVELWRTTVAITLLAVLQSLAILHDIQRRLASPSGWRGCRRDLMRAVSKPTNVKSIEQLCAENGFIAEQHTVTTEDGYYLMLYRLRKASHDSTTNGHTNGNSSTNGHAHMNGNGYHDISSLSAGASVLLQHGLFQTCLPFIFNGGAGSLAFVLANRGVDVWLGNNRGCLHSRRHKVHSPDEDAFWNFGIDEHEMDVAANVEYIVNHNDDRPFTFIGHSQGAAQAFIAFAKRPKLQSSVNQFIALSPGAFVKQLESRPLRLLARLANHSPRLFFIMFGRGPLLPFMEIMRKYLGIRTFGYLAFCMFNYLMKWGDDYWDRTRKFLYFSQTPGGTSSRTVAQWMQQAASGRFFSYNYCNIQENRRRYGTDESPDVALANVRLPVSVIYGGEDNLLDYNKLIERLPNCVFKLCVPHHQHMDNLNAMDAKELVYPEIIRLLNTRFAHLPPIPSSSN